jgi:hypothetical protein
MTALYSRLYSDVRHSGFVDAISSASGKLAWTVKIAAEGETPAEARLLLCDGTRIAVDGPGLITVFDREGRSLWKRPKWPGTSIALQDEWLFFVSPEERDILQAVDFDNQMQLPEVPILGLISRATPEMLEPSRDELVAQIFDTGVPEEAGSNLLIYKMRFEGSGFDWSHRYPGGQSRIQPLLCPDQRRLVTSVHDEVLVFDLDGSGGESEPVSRFAYPIETTALWLSASAAGVLYWAGFGKNGLEAVATDLLGNELWRWKLTSVDQVQGTPVAPLIIAGETAYLLNSTSLYALRGGEQVWSYEPMKSGFRNATGLPDGSVVIAAATGLFRIDATGLELFALEFEETLVTPPVIDDQGRIYVASKETLYAFD